MDMQFENSCCGREWKRFIDKNSKAMFQTALLLAANPRGAEAALITSMDELDISRRPETHDLPIWEETVVKLSVGTPEMLSTERDDFLACSLLQPGLRPVIQLDRLPRICFVLQVLLGYTTEACAAVLGVKESEVPVLVAEAATKLPQTVVTVANCRSQPQLASEDLAVTVRPPADRSHGNRHSMGSVIGPEFAHEILDVEIHGSPAMES